MTTAPRIIPPVYVLASVIAMGLLDRFAPIRSILPRSHVFAGVACVALSLLVGLPSALAFRRAGTVLHPGPGSSAIVTAGAYRFTRNPMYLGLVLLAFGAAFLFGSLSCLFVPPVLALVLHSQFIVREEKWMEETFADEYLQYKSSVRRWL